MDTPIIPIDDTGAIIFTVVVILILCAAFAVAHRYNR